MTTVSIKAAGRDTFVRMLTNLGLWLDAAEACAKEKGFDAAILLQARLAPDMLPLISQIRRATDFARNGAGRLGAVAEIKFDGEEQTFAEIKARLAASIAHIGEIPDAAFDDAPQRPFTVRAGGVKPMSMNAEDYLLSSALPNFYFHVSMAYAILRHNGVPIGKKDFLG